METSKIYLDIQVLSSREKISMKIVYEAIKLNGFTKSGNLHREEKKTKEF